MMRIYSHHLLELDLNNFIKNKDYKLNFLSENCFTLQNKEDIFLTAFPNGETKFFAKKCEHWEKFYILDGNTLALIEHLVSSQEYTDFTKKSIKDFKLTLSLNRIRVILGGTIITPSFLPPSKVVYKKHLITYTGLDDVVCFNKNSSKIIYFCIYGSDEYYSMFEIALKSLIEFGHYSGDILVKTDNVIKIIEIMEKNNIRNRIFTTEWKSELGIFNRYDLQEDFLVNYDTVVYFDSDILTISPLTQKFWNYISNGDIAIYSEFTNQDIVNSKLFRWFGFEHIVKNVDSMNQIKKFHLFNSGFFAINNLEKVKEILDKIIEYNIFRRSYGDQPFLNMALYNSSIDICDLQPNYYLGFARSEFDFYRNIQKENIFVHYNSGVGRLSKLDLMKLGYEFILENTKLK